MRRRFLDRKWLEKAVRPVRWNTAFFAALKSMSIGRTSESSGVGAAC